MDSKVLGIALESSAVPFLQPTPSAGNVKIMHLSQHKRNGRFTETLVKHGFARDTSLFAASRASERRIIRTKHRFESMDSLVEEFHREVAELFGIQNELIRLQKMMATRALEVFSVRVIQQAVRSWVARHKLMMLKLSRFICDRVYFLRYYKRRVKAACRLAMRILMFLARRTLKIHLKRKNSAIRIQKLYNKWKLLRAIKFRIIVLGKMGRLLKHVMLFGKCRAIMHMRRLDVQRVQEEEQAQYTALLALEQQRQAEEELKAAEELKRLEQEALKKARAKMIAAAKKQAKEAALVAAVHGKGKRAKGKNIAPTSATLSTAIENDISAIEAAAQLAAAQVVANTLAHKVAVESEPPVDHYTAPVSTVLIIQAVSAGIITGQNTSQVMHNWVINRYGSVYGGMYGEYCCVGDNRVRSFAAVRFRFMLRCFRKKRLKA